MEGSSNLLGLAAGVLLVVLALVATGAFVVGARARHDGTADAPRLPRWQLVLSGAVVASLCLLALTSVVASVL